MSEVARMRAELNRISAELASVQDQMAPFLMRRKAVRDKISRYCFDLNQLDQKVKSWRPMGPSNIALLDEVNIWAAEGLRPLKPRHDSLKEAKRLAEINLKRAKEEQGKNGEKTGKSASKHFPRSSAGPLSRKGTGNPSPRFPSPNGGKTGGTPLSTHNGPAGKQGDLF